MYDQNYLSLYQYLGKAAGRELGRQVYDASLQKGVPITTQDVFTKSYTGKVVKYPKQFLDEYFAEQYINQLNKLQNETR